MKRPRPSINRRQMFRLRSEAGQALAQPGPGPGERGRASEQPWYDLVKASRPAMGSYFEVRVPAHSPGAADVATRALDVIDALEDQLTVYRDESELSQLNARAHLGPVEVEAGLFGLLEQAVAIGNATGGAYDLTAGALSMAWGFFKGPRRVPDAETLAAARACTGQHHLCLDPGARTIAFDRAGIVINLGSIGKGYAIDRAVDVIRAHPWPTGGLVHGGRSSVYALGSPPGHFAGRWPIALRNPFDPEKPLGVVRLRNRALGTSGTSFQRFEVDGKTYGHILDPRTGAPADGPASVSVLAPTAALADALSTAFYLLGTDGAADYIEQHPDVGAIFVQEGREPDRPRIITLGLTEFDFERDGDAAGILGSHGDA
ncbi:MAG TPA: FAD:protein FMN transferase [Isosphaeraceae bacterium]|nr:FAD:protein FMN transferase [Isosphaeraceae bacterium]